MSDKLWTVGTVVLAVVVVYWSVFEDDDWGDLPEAVPAVNDVANSAMTFNVTIIRHGETDFNAKNLIHSCTDGTINENGIQQAKELGKSLEDQVYTRVYSSDLQRCQDTAKYMLEQLKTTQPEVKLDKRLRERDYGDWDGQPSSLIWKQAKERGVDVREVTAPGGETFKDAFARIVSFIEELLNEVDKAEKDENVAVFSHGITIQQLLGYFNAKKDGGVFELENFNYERWKFATNTALTRFTIGKAGSGANGARKIVFHCIHDDSHVSNKSGNHKKQEEFVKKMITEEAVSFSDKLELDSSAK